MEKFPTNGQGVPMFVLFCQCWELGGFLFFKKIFCVSGSSVILVVPSTSCALPLQHCSSRGPASAALDPMGDAREEWSK